MPNLHDFQQLADDCLPTLNARINFNNQLLMVNNAQSNEILDYYSAIIPDILMIYRLRGCSDNELLELCKKFNEDVNIEISHFSVLQEAINNILALSPQTDEQIIQKMEKLASIYIYYKVITYNSKLGREEGIKNISALVESIPKTKNVNLKYLLRYATSEYLDLCMEDKHYEEILKKLKCFLIQHQPHWAEFLKSIKQIESVGKITNNEILAKKVKDKLAIVNQKFKSNASQYTEEQSKEYLGRYINIYKRIPKDTPYFTNLVETIETLQKDFSLCLANYMTLKTLSDEIESLGCLLNEWCQSQAQKQNVNESSSEDVPEQRNFNKKVQHVKKKKLINNKVKRDCFVENISVSKASLQMICNTDCQEKELTSHQETNVVTSTPDVSVNVEQNPAELDEVVALETQQVELNDENDEAIERFNDGTLFMWEQSKKQPKNVGDVQLNAVLSPEQERFQYYAQKLNSHKDVFQRMFTNNIHLQFKENKLISIIRALDGRVEEGEGSRKRIFLNNITSDIISSSKNQKYSNRIVIHSQHGPKAQSRDNKLPSLCVKNYVDVLTKAGFTPDKLWPEEYGNDLRQIGYPN